MMIKRSLAAVLAIALIATATADARQPKSMGLSSKVTEADFVGIAVAESGSEMSGSQPGYSVLRVEQVIKGDKLLQRVRLVTRGYISEQDPSCCVEGRRYLIFAKRGYLVASASDEGFGVERRGEQDYFSSVNGRSGVFLVCNKNVKDWADNDDASLESVVQAIREAKSES